MLEKLSYQKLSSEISDSSSKAEQTIIEDTNRVEVEGHNMQEIFDEKFQKILKEFVKRRDENLRYFGEEKVNEMLDIYFSELNDFYIEMNLNFSATRDSVVEKLGETKEEMSRLLYTDTRFSHTEINNKRFIRKKIKEIIENLFLKEHHARLEEGKKYGRISLDVNGLKSMNDFAGHDVGDKFLNAVVKELAEIKNEVSNNNPEITIETSSEGGDEFGFMLTHSGKKIVDGKTISITGSEIDTQMNSAKEQIYNLLDERIRTMNENNVIVDFRIPAIKAKIANQMKVSEEKIKMPENFTFKPSIAYGYTNLGDAFKTAMQELSGKSPEEAINKVMGHWFKDSEDRMSEKKESDKNLLKTSDKDDEKFQYFLLQRNEEARKLAEENLALRETITSLQEDISELKQTIKTILESRDQAFSQTNLLKIIENDKTSLAASLRKLQKLSEQKDILLQELLTDQNLSTKQKSQIAKKLTEIKAEERIIKSSVNSIPR